MDRLGAIGFGAGLRGINCCARNVRHLFVLIS
jgi:hypothetical protein